MIQHDLGGKDRHYTTVPEVGPQARFVYGFKPWIVQAQATLISATYKGDLDGSGWTLHYLMPEDKDHQAKKLTRGPVVASARAIGTREGIDDCKDIETLRYDAQAKHSTDNLRFLDSYLDPEPRPGRPLRHWRRAEPRGHGCAWRRIRLAARRNQGPHRRAAEALVKREHVVGDVIVVRVSVGDVAEGFGLETW